MGLFQPPRRYGRIYRRQRPVKSNRGRSGSLEGTAVRKFAAVIFDVDDTLFDREAAQLLVLDIIIERYPELFGKHDKQKIAEAFLESDRLVTRDFQDGKPSSGLRRSRSIHFLQLLGLSDEYADKLTDFYVHNLPGVRATMEGADELISRLSGQYRIGIISNGLPDVQYRKLESIGIRQHCHCVVLSEELGIRKPDAGIFLHTASLLGVPPAACLYVGNSYRDDVIGAANAGMSACWFNRKAVSPPENTDFVPSLVITRLRELPALLAGHVNRQAGAHT